MQNTMKFLYKSTLLLVLCITASTVYISCSEDNLPNNGEPRIRYVRITAPESGDSLLVAGIQGNKVAIIGENLQGATQVWFNDRRAFLSPTYVTSTTIITAVPDQLPDVVSDKLTLVFGNGTRMATCISRAPRAHSPE